jgi:hypothetical protein
MELLIYQSLITFAIVFVLSSIAKTILNKCEIYVLDDYFCLKCISFWSGLLFFGIYVGAVAALMAVAFDSKFSETKL